MSNAIRITEIVNHILPGIELEKTDHEYIFSRGPHHVAWEIERLGNIPDHSIIQIARGVIYDLVNLELEAIK